LQRRFLLIAGAVLILANVRYQNGHINNLFYGYFSFLIKNTYAKA
jgi:hypothetical protein